MKRFKMQSISSTAVTLRFGRRFVLSTVFPIRFGYLVWIGQRSVRL